MFNTTGTLKYYEDGIRAILIVEQSIVDYYFSLIPRYNHILKPGWAAHITVVRPDVDIVSNSQYWNKYQNEKIDIIYDSYIHYDYGFYWINAWSKRLDEIRSELGLTIISRITIPPVGYSKCYHCTVARNKFESKT